MSRHNVAAQKASGEHGQFGELPRSGNSHLDLPAQPVVEQVPVYTIMGGDTVWVDGNPVVVKALVLDRPWDATIVDADGRSHSVGDQTAVVYRSKTPLAPFDDVDWDEACSFDDWESEQGQVDTLVRYNADGFGQVSATLTGMGDYRFHAAYYLGGLANFDTDTVLPDGRTKGEALDRWTTDVVMNAVDEGIRERYGWDAISGDDADAELRPQVWATNTAAGEIDAETAANLLWPAQARLINESDPGTFNAEYPYRSWIDKAVKQLESEGKPALPW